MFISQVFYNKLADLIDKSATRCRYLMDGQLYTVPVIDTDIEFKVNGVVVKKYVSISNVNGTITEMQLIDDIGTVYGDKPSNIVQTNEKSMLVVFQTEWIEQEGDM